MTVARLLLEIRRRATAAPDDVPRRAALREVAREVLQLGDGEELDVELLEGLTPETVLRMDMSRADGEAGAMRALRAAVVKPGRN